MGKRSSDKNNRDIATNRRARHDYAIEETFEAGVALLGSEVKSLRDGHASLVDGHVEPRGGELWLLGVHILEYPFAHQNNHEPRRPRKLLLNRAEIDRITRRVSERGYTCVPLKLYFKAGRVKALLGLGKGKRQVDRREDVKERDARREIERAMKG